MKKKEILAMMRGKHNVLAMNIFFFYKLERFKLIYPVWEV